MNKRRQKKIAVVVDNPIRDLPACTLVVAALAEQGYESHLVSFDNAAQGVFSIQPDYVLANYARVTNEKFLRRLHASRIPVGILDTEGGIFAKMDDGSLNVSKVFSRREDVNRKISDYFVWGRVFFNYLKERGPFPSEVLRLTGSPRTDVLHPSLRSSDHSKDIILINTSFPFANPKFRSAEEEAEDLMKRFGFPRDYVYKDLRAQQSTQKRFIELTAELACHFPEEQFVLRPHPFEGHEIYKAKLDGISNLQIRGDGAIDTWLERSKALVHFECSTALEACLMGVPALAMKEFASQRPVEAISLVTDYCDTQAELISKLKLILTGAYKASASLESDRSKVIGDIYLKFDGKNYQDVVAAVTKSLSVSNNKNIFVCHFWRAFYFLRNRLKMLLGKQIIRKEKAFSLDDVSELILRFQTSSAGLGRRIQIKKNAGASGIRIEHGAEDAAI